MMCVCVCVCVCVCLLCDVHVLHCARTVRAWMPGLISPMPLFAFEMCEHPLLVKKCLAKAHFPWFMNEASLSLPIRYKLLVYFLYNYLYCFRNPNKRHDGKKRMRLALACCDAEL